MIEKKIAGDKFQELIEILEKLRSQEGCPWDQKQTSKSLIPYLLEETYEVIEAIEKKDMDSLKEELGDLMLHLLFQSKLAADKGYFNISDSLKEISLSKNLKAQRFVMWIYLYHKQSGTMPTSLKQCWTVLISLNHYEVLRRIKNGKRNCWLSICRQ